MKHLPSLNAYIASPLDKKCQTSPDKLKISEKVPNEHKKIFYFRRKASEDVRYVKTPKNLKFIFSSLPIGSKTV